MSVQDNTITILGRTLRRSEVEYMHGLFHKEAEAICGETEPDGYEAFVTGVVDALRGADIDRRPTWPRYGTEELRSRQMTGTIQTFIPTSINVERLDDPSMRFVSTAEKEGDEWTWAQDGRRIRLGWVDTGVNGVIEYSVVLDGHAVPMWVQSAWTATGSPTTWTAYMGRDGTVADCPVAAVARLLTAILPAKV